METRQQIRLNLFENMSISSVCRFDIWSELQKTSLQDHGQFQKSEIVEVRFKRLVGISESWMCGFESWRCGVGCWMCGLENRMCSSHSWHCVIKVGRVNCIISQVVSFARCVAFKVGDVVSYARFVVWNVGCAVLIVGDGSRRLDV